MVENDDWAKLNQAITDGSLYTAGLRQLRRYLKVANDRRVSVGPSLPATIQQLITQQETRRQARWTVIGAVAALIAAVASVLGLILPWR